MVQLQIYGILSPICMKRFYAVPSLRSVPRSALWGMESARSRGCWKRIEENLRLVESGELSPAKLAERHDVSKSTVYRMQKAEEAGG